jgi:hypothetical protein
MEVRTVYVDEATSSSLELVVRDNNRNQVDCPVHFFVIGAGTTAALKIAYGIVDLNGDKRAGDGSGSRTDTARYTVDLGTAGAFKEKPVIVACTEHVSQAHLRQAQVRDPTASDNVYRYLKVDTVKEGGGVNTCRFHYIAYAPS